MTERVEPTPLVIGQEFAGCRVEAVIGRGGMGVVYRGLELSLERPVAIKLITADRADDADARRRFEREARLMAAIDHPNVIPVYGAGEENGHLYLVMRYVDGIDLQQRLRTEGALAPTEAARVIDQVAHALDAAHARGLVHRDIKPANVLLSGDHVYLTDFGITRLVDEHTGTTEAGEWIGTVDFMAPEHLRGETTDARSDIYSLGCVLYACLTGVPPFKRPNTAATIAAQLHERPPAPSQLNPSLPRGFDHVVGRALAKKPSHRYLTAGQLGAAALDAAAGKGPRWGRRGDAAAAAPTQPAAAAAAAAAAAVASPVTAGTAPLATAKQTARTARQTARQTASEARTQVAADGIPTLVVKREPRRRPLRTLALAAALVVIAAVVIGVVALVEHKSKPKPVLALTANQVVATVNAFAAAYGSREIDALSRVLAPNVTRVDSSGSEHGVAAVLADYRQQFDTKPVPVSYTTSNLIVTGGWVGRASGSYSVQLKGGSTLGGHVIFGVQRVNGRVVIGLIATQQGG